MDIAGRQHTRTDGLLQASEVMTACQPQSPVSIGLSAGLNRQGGSVTAHLCSQLRRRGWGRSWDLASLGAGPQEAQCAALARRRGLPGLWPRVLEPRTIGERVRARRWELGLTQREFAKRLGVVPESVWEWGRGVTSPPRGGSGRPWGENWLPLPRRAVRLTTDPGAGPAAARTDLLPKKWSIFRGADQMMRPTRA